MKKIRKFSESECVFSIWGWLFLVISQPGGEVRRSAGRGHLQLGGLSAAHGGRGNLSTPCVANIDFGKACEVEPLSKKGQGDCLLWVFWAKFLLLKILSTTLHFLQYIKYRHCKSKKFILHWGKWLLDKITLPKSWPQTKNKFQHTFNSWPATKKTFWKICLKSNILIINAVKEFFRKNILRDHSHL